jgi:hypothetical protein
MSVEIAFPKRHPSSEEKNDAPHRKKGDIAPFRPPDRCSAVSFSSILHAGDLNGVLVLEIEEYPVVAAAEPEPGQRWLERGRFLADSSPNRSLILI